MNVLPLLVFFALAFEYALAVNCRICDKNGCINHECDECKVHLNNMHVECKQSGHCQSDEHHKCCHDEACMSATLNVTMITCPVCDGHKCHNQQCMNCQFDLSNHHSHCKGHDCHWEDHKVCCNTAECVHKYQAVRRTTTELPVVTTSQTTETSTPVSQTTKTTNNTSGKSVFCYNCADARDSGCLANATRCHDKSCLIRHDMKTGGTLVSCMDTQVCNVLSQMDNGSTICCLEDSCSLNFIRTVLVDNTTAAAVTSETTTQTWASTSDTVATLDTTIETTTTTSVPTSATTETLTTTSGQSSTTQSLCHDEDDGYINCESLNNMYGFCNADPAVYSDAYFYAYTKCKKTCGHCNDTFHPSTTKAPITADHRDTTTQCYQCGDIASNFPCDTRYVYNGAPMDCPSNKHFCQTDAVYTGSGNVEIYKRCVDEATCKSEWLDQTSDVDACIDASGIPVFGNYVCHYCCVGDACNSDVIPANSSLYT